MSESESIQLNFGKPMPLFPLDQVALLPQQVLPLHIFEPRYRQLVDDALNGPGLLAMATFQGDDWKKQYHGRPQLRTAVCVGYIAHHEKTEDGRYYILVQGVCRARIVRELPADGQRLYRAAVLEPLETDPAAPLPLEAEDHTLDEARASITAMLTDGPLSRWRSAEALLRLLRDDDVPTHVVLDVVGPAFAPADPSLRYALLSEPDPRQRARLVVRELTSLQRLVRLAEHQHPELWPKGMSWN
jgi:uncharacterized protein